MAPARIIESDYSTDTTTSSDYGVKTEQSKKMQMSGVKRPRTYEKTKAALKLEREHCAGNYHPLGVVFDRALGAKVWDVDGNEYIDCLSAYSAVNQGHCHPRILATLSAQMSKLTLPSRAFHSAELGRFAHKICTLLDFERVLTMNTGAEAIETAIKLARKWAYVKKGVPDDKAIVYSAAGCFHGRTLASISLSSDEYCREGFGPFVPGLGPTVELPDGTSFDIRFNHAEDLERAFELHGENVAAFVVEPIQGEAGIIVPTENYLRQVQDLCRRHNVLFICDEIQAGLGRTGKLLAHHHWGVKPDIVTLAKALSGGTYPISAVLSSSEIMDCIKPGQHGSTYGGNPLACAIACTSLDVLISENLISRSLTLGEHFRTRLTALKHITMDHSSTSSPGGGGGGLVTAVRGLGLMNAIDINPDISTKGRGAWHLCLLMASKGVLAKPTHRHTIRLAPPLVIEEEDLDRAVDVIEECLRELDAVEVIEDLSVHAGSETFVSL